MAEYTEECPECHSNEFREEITGGMRQTVIYRDGFIVKETTEYEGNYKHSKGFCNKCGHEFKEYNF